jgi:hypothetical protein
LKFIKPLGRKPCVNSQGFSFKNKVTDQVIVKIAQGMGFKWNRKQHSKWNSKQYFLNGIENS